MPTLRSGTAGLGVGLYLLGVGLFSINDALGKWLVKDYGVGQLMMLRSIGAAIVLAPMILKLRVKLIEPRRAALQVLPVERINGLLRFAVVLHLDEAKTARAAGLPVRDHLGPPHRAVCLEQGRQFLIGNLPGQIAHIDILRHNQPFEPESPSTLKCCRLRRPPTCVKKAVREDSANEPQQTGYSAPAKAAGGTERVDRMASQPSA